VENISASKLRPKKTDFSIDKTQENALYTTPQSVKQEVNTVEKENKYRFWVYSQARAHKTAKGDENEEMSIFKKPI
jgi:hypothetical protein